MIEQDREGQYANASVAALHTSLAEVTADANLFLSLVHFMTLPLSICHTT
jgi:hypothetical protein